jgi:hypothetical protein
LITIGITNTNYTNSFVVNYPVGTSGSINGSATANRLVFLNTVVGNYAGSPFSTQPIVEIETTVPNSPVTTDLSPVTLSITSGSGTLAGCTGNEILGIVTFSGCTIDPGGSYQITAQDGNLTPATSNTFTVSPSTYQLVFTAQPVAGGSGSTFTTQPVVSVENVQYPYTVDTAWSGTITLTLSGGALSNCPGSTATVDTLHVTNGAGAMRLLGRLFLQRREKPAHDGHAVHHDGDRQPHGTDGCRRSGAEPDLCGHRFRCRGATRVHHSADRRRQYELVRRVHGPARGRGGRRVRQRGDVGRSSGEFDGEQRRTR